MSLYCENEECRVVLYESVEHEGTPPDEPNNNCPGCGQFGRKKGK